MVSPSAVPSCKHVLASVVSLQYGLTINKHVPISLLFTGSSNLLSADRLGGFEEIKLLLPAS